MKLILIGLIAIDLLLHLLEVVFNYRFPYPKDRKDYNFFWVWYWTIGLWIAFQI